VQDVRGSALWDAASGKVDLSAGEKAANGSIAFLRLAL
jgi:hypothetical protein